MRTFALVDDHPVFRLGVRRVIEGNGLGEVIGEAASVDGLRALLARRPTVLVSDLHVEGRALFDVLPTPWPRVLVLSGLDELIYAERCIAVGAAGFVRKRDPVPVLCDALRRVSAGEVVLGDGVLRRVTLRLAGGGAVADPLSALSARELQVFGLLGVGRGVGEIAADLGLSSRTVETHRARIKRKLGVRDADQLLRLAVGHAGSGISPTPAPGAQLHRSGPLDLREDRSARDIPGDPA